MAATTTTTTKRRPIRGFLYGIVLGLGLTLLVVGQGIAALGTWPPFLVLIGGIVAGTLWSTFGPAKAPKGAPPIEPQIIEDPAPVADEPVAYTEPDPEPRGDAEPDTEADADGGEDTTDGS